VFRIERRGDFLHKGRLILMAAGGRRCSFNGILGAPDMARRKKRPVDDFTRFTVAVQAASARISRLGPDIYTLAPDGEADSTIDIEGLTDLPALRDIRRVVISVHCKDGDKGNPGAAIGVNHVWHVVVSLPTAQSTHLLSLVHSGQLQTASIGVQGLRRGRGVVRTVDFSTAPVPFYREMEE